MTILPETGTPGSRLAALGLAVLVLAAVVSFAILPAIERVRAERASLATLQQQVLSTEARITAYKSSPVQIDTIPALAGRLIAMETMSTGTSTALKGLRTEIDKAGCSIASVEQLPPAPAGPALRLRVRVKLACKIDGLQTILHRIENGTPIMMVEALSVRSRAGQAGNAGLLDIELTAAAFALSADQTPEKRS